MSFTNCWFGGKPLRSANCKGGGLGPVLVLAFRSSFSTPFIAGFASLEFRDRELFFLELSPLLRN